MLYQLNVVMGLLLFTKANLHIKHNDVNGSVVIIEDAEALFGLTISDHIKPGYIYKVDPFDACTSVEPPNFWNKSNPSYGYFGLVLRGNCSFVAKATVVQMANFKGLIVINNEGDDVFPMSNENDVVINIPVIMIGKSSGNMIISSFLHDNGYYAVMVPNENSIIEYYVLPFLIILCLFFIAIAVFLIVRVVRTYLQHSKNRLNREGLSKLQEIRFSIDYASMYDVCAICLEEYILEEKLRILPCNHAFHSKCVDRWLLRQQDSCPVCKYRIRKDKNPNITVTQIHNSIESVTSSTYSSVIESVHIGSVERVCPSTIQEKDASRLNRVRLLSVDANSQNVKSDCFSERRSYSVNRLDNELSRENYLNLTVSLSESQSNLQLNDKAPLIPSGSTKRNRNSKNRNLGADNSENSAAMLLSTGKLVKPSQSSATWLGFDNLAVHCADSITSFENDQYPRSNKPISKLTTEPFLSDVDIVSEADANKLHRNTTNHYKV